MNYKISQKEYDDFLSLFSSLPSISLLHIKNNCTLVDRCLEDIRVKNDGTIVAKELKNINCDRFRLKSREYEFVILSDIFNDCTNKKTLLSACYHSLENSSCIIILENKKNNNTNEIIELLDTLEYRVPNSISVFENHNLIVAKKLHMWGNGL